MTKQFIFSTLAIVPFLIASPAEAGFFDKLADRVQDRVENVVSGKVAKKAGDKAGEATDAVINPESDDKVVEQPSSANGVDVNSRSEAAVENAPSAIGGLGGMLQALQQKVIIEESYRFTLKTKTEITSEGNLDVVEQSFSSDAFHVQIDDNQSMIMDMKNEAMIMIDKKAKTKSPISSQFLRKMAKMGGVNLSKEVKESLAVDRLKKTKKTKKILDYKASLWTYEDGRDSGEIWITEEVDFDFVGFNKRLMGMFDNGGGQFSLDFSKLQGQLPNGLPLETTLYVDGKVKTKSRVIAVSKEFQVIDLANYQEQSMMGQR